MSNREINCLPLLYLCTLDNLEESCFFSACARLIPFCHGMWKSVILTCSYVNRLLSAFHSTVPNQKIRSFTCVSGLREWVVFTALTKATTHALPNVKYYHNKGHLLLSFFLWLPFILPNPLLSLVQPGNQHRYLKGLSLFMIWNGSILLAYISLASCDFC